MSKPGMLDNIAGAVRQIPDAVQGAAREALDARNVDNVAESAERQVLPTPEGPNAAQTESIVEGSEPLNPTDVQAYRAQRQMQKGFKDIKYKSSTPSDLLFETYVNNLLWNPSTHVTNALSNTAQALMAPIDTGARAILTMFSKPQDKVYLSEVVGDIYGMMHGVYKAIQYTGSRALNSFPGRAEFAEQTAQKYGISPGILSSKRLDYVNRKMSSQGMGIDETSILGKLTDGLGAMVNAPTSILNASDIGFKIIHDSRYRTRWAAHEVAAGRYKSYADAMEAVSKDPEVAKRAVSEAEYYTFTGRPNMPMFSWVTDTAMEKMPGLRWVIPFKRTIANIAEQTIERSPLALASPTMLRRLTSADPIERSTAQSRLLAGTGILTAGAYMFGENLIGAAPMDRTNKDLWERTFGPEFSLKFGDGVIKLDQLGIIGQQLKSIAMYRQVLETLPDREFDPESPDDMMKKAAMFGAPVAEMLYSNHFAENLAQFFEVFDRAREMNSIAPIEQWAERMAVRTLPGIGSSAWETYQRSNDPIQRDTAKLGAQFAMLLPEQRKLIRPVFDIYGFPMVVNNIRGPNSTHEMNPYAPNDPVAKKFLELGMEFKQLPDEIRTAPPNVQLADGKKVRLTDEEYLQMHKWKAEGLYKDLGNGEKYPILPPFREYMATFVNQPGLERFPKETQKKRLTAFKEKYQESLYELVKTLPSVQERLMDTTIKHGEKMKREIEARGGMQ